MSDNPTKYEVLIEQYLRSILDISEREGLGKCWKLSPATLTAIFLCVPVHPSITQNNDKQRDEETKSHQVDDVELIRQLLGIPVGVAADSGRNGNESVPTHRWRNRQQNRI